MMKQRTHSSRDGTTSIKWNTPGIDRLMPVKRLFLIAPALFLVFVSVAAAKGRKPANRDQGFGWDDSRVKRGSPANPTSAYQPPQFGTHLPETRDEYEARQEKKASKKEPKKTDTSKQENWTFEDGSMKNNAQPVDAQPKPPVQPPAPNTTLESGEQALPEYPTEDPLEKQQKK